MTLLCGEVVEGAVSNITIEVNGAWLTEINWDSAEFG